MNPFNEEFMVRLMSELDTSAVVKRFPSNEYDS